MQKTYLPGKLLRTRQRLLPQRLLKHLQRHLRLVIRHLMPRRKHPQKPKIILLLERAAWLAVDVVRRERLGLEGRGAGKIDGVGDGLAAEPVADEVGVAGPDDGLHAGFDNVAELGQETAGVVAGGGEFVVDVVGTLLVSK